MSPFRYPLSFALICLTLFLSPTWSCGEELSADEQLVYFEQHVRPLLVSRCYSCHSARAKKSEGGLLLDSRSGWSEGGDTGTAIVPGDVEASLLIRAVRYADPDLQMPPDKALTKDAVAKLERWVQWGAPDPRDGMVSEGVTSINPSDPIAGREHWAYRPLAETILPQVEAQGWPESAIDTFILAGLEAAKLSPSADADRRTLVRRVYVQLIGLPPTPEQTTEFLTDERTDALERLVDHLLVSPLFGERWGRHWLDLARYADSNGLDENFLFREAWRYRNQVIGAINADVPFDQFLRAQIAGDLLPYDTIEQRDRQRIAAGFLEIGPKVLLVDDRDLQRMEVADEQLDTIGKAILGQTLGCARCHDHKFDPIPTADYYALAGILTSTQVMEKRQMLNQQRNMEQLVGLGPNGDELNGEYEKFWRQRKEWDDQKKRVEMSLELLNAGDVLALQSLAKEQNDSVNELALDGCADLGQRLAVQQELLDKLKKRLAEPPPIPPRAMIPRDANDPRDEHIRLAGQADRLGDVVPRGFLRVLTNTEVTIPAGASGRLELSDWLTNTSGGAGHLTARVLANRVWQHLIGSGLVRTVDNFGRTGEVPSHPELLDHLATELIASGWSIKSLVRQVVLSRSFAMSSQHDEAGYAIDPDNRLLWRANRRRVDPETLRDAMLLAAGTLDLTPVDSTVSYLGDQATAVGANKVRRRTDFPCRSVYLPVIRNDLPELFDVFDFANPQATTGLRPETMVAAQGLFILNDGSVIAASDATAKRLLDEPIQSDDVRVDRMYELIVNEPATAEERSEVLSFVKDFKGQLALSDDDAGSLRAWSMVCQALLASSRFQIVE